MVLFSLLPNVDAENEKARRIRDTNLHHINSNRYCRLREYSFLFTARQFSFEWINMHWASTTHATTTNIISKILLLLFTRKQQQQQQQQKIFTFTFEINIILMLQYEATFYCSALYAHCLFFWFWCKFKTFIASNDRHQCFCRSTLIQCYWM